MFSRPHYYLKSFNILLIRLIGPSLTLLMLYYYQTLHTGAPLYNKNLQTKWKIMFARVFRTGSIILLFQAGHPSCIFVNLTASKLFLASYPPRFLIFLINFTEVHFSCSRCYTIVHTFL